MSLRYGLLCLLALFVAVALAVKNYETWTLPAEVAPEKGPAKKTAVKADSPAPPSTTGAPGQKEPSPVESNVLIAGKNLFSPERKDFPILTDPAKEVRKPVVRPQVILYGVTIVGDHRSASITSPGRPLQKGERETMTVKVGDRIGEYKISSILPDRITLEAQGDTFDALLYDAKAPKKRVVARTETKPATITSTLPGPAAPPGPPQPVPPGVAMSGEAVRGSPAEIPVPRPITPASMPTPRVRRWQGSPTPGQAVGE